MAKVTLESLTNHAEYHDLLQAHLKVDDLTNAVVSYLESSLMLHNELQIIVGCPRFRFHIAGSFVANLTFLPCEQEGECTSIMWSNQPACCWAQGEKICYRVYDDNTFTARSALVVQKGDIWELTWCNADIRSLHFTLLTSFW